MSVFKPVDPKQSFPQMENQITNFWKQHKIFEKSIEQRPKADKYIFYDGPPFITGSPHYGSLLPSIAKDLIPRYQTMKGKRVERKWGWDCHGLPIENKVEKNVGLKNRRDIEKFGIQKFIDECYNYTKETSAEWEWYIDKIGRWVDFENSYKTMDQEYMESVIWVFKQLWEKDLVYQGNRVSLYCTRCGTPVSNFEIAMDNSYTDMEDPAVTIKFEIKDAKTPELKGASILAWTTTPWTLPSNRALVVDPEEDYVVVELTREVHERKGIGAIVVDVQERKAIVIRDKNKINTFVAGDIKQGENEEDAAKREIFEETGYKDIKVVQKIGNEQFYSPLKNFNYFYKNYNYYLCELNSKDKVKPTNPDHPGDEAVWISLENLEGTVTYKGAKPFAKLINEFYKKGTIKEINIKEESYVDASPGESFKERIILAEKRLKDVLEVDEKGTKAQYEITKKIKGKELVGLSYKPLFDYFSSNENDLKVYAFKGMVTMDEGTGIVHSAPGFGDIDTEMGNELGLTLMTSVDEEGKFIKEVKDYAGIYVKDADPLIMRDLTAKNMLLKSERIIHRYPYCYRCTTPLIHKAQPSWFLKINELRDKMLETNENINWVPDHLKEGRFKKGIETAPDWCISRTRYWATPMPVWECECGEREVFGSIAEIEKRSGQKVVDLHRPKIDEITFPCKKCKETMRRVPEVLDVWMDSGSMPYAQKHYPFENKKDFEANYPADFIVEYIGQTRAWFYVMHVLSNALFDTESFKNVVTTGVIFGTDGRKMSKSYGNYPDPKKILETYGAEPLRMYLMSSPIMVGEDLNIDEQGLKDQLKSFILPLWNSYSFLTTYANMHNWRPNETLLHNRLEKKDNVKFVEGEKIDTFWYKVPFEAIDNKMDQWIIARLQQVIKNVRVGMDEYNIPAAAREYPQFLNDLSKWYIRRSRERFNKGDSQAMSSLYYVLIEFMKLLAPFMPFLTEEVWQNLVVGKIDNAAESIHLTDFPQDDLEFVENSYKLLVQMEAIRLIVAMGQSIRVEQGMKVRQPLAELEVNLDIAKERDYEIEQWMKDLIAEELNVKLVDEDNAPSKSKGWIYKESEDGRIQLSLNVTLTDELKREGLLREFIRTIQSKRKRANLKLEDVIKLEVTTESSQILTVIDMFKDEIQEGTNADDLEVKKAASSSGQKINGQEVDISFV